MARYSAKKKRGQKDAYVVEFRHPVILDKMGKQGKKIRRGLGLDEREADEIVEDLNKILSDEKYWYISEIKNADKVFHKKAVEIFYSYMEETIINDSWLVREEYLALPNKEDGYCRVLLQGATGSGKTTIIRQLIGTKPEEISFPAISSSRTTICDTEFIFSEHEMAKAIVTFNTQSQTIKLIEECVIEGFKRAVLKEGNKDIAKALLTHPEQRFRLSYMLGQYKIQKQIEKEAVEEDGGEKVVPNRKELYAELERIIEKIKNLAIEAEEIFQPQSDNVDEVIELLYEDYLREDSEQFAEIVNNILATIKSKFMIVAKGEYKFDNRGWPVYWKIETKNKEELLEQMKWFAGNDGRKFGQLLAPVVNGIRISANFKPHWLKEDIDTKLVIIDGEGVGHNSNTMTSIPINITKKFQDVDIIAIVDNAVQPMLNIPKVIISDVASRGYHNKLALLYTRFEDVQGASLIDDEDRQDHVIAIQDGAIESFEAQGMNRKVVRQVREHLKNNVYFLSRANDLKNTEEELIEQLESFLCHCVKVVEEKEQIATNIPKYDYGRLYLVVKDAAEVFGRKWSGILGISNSEYPKRHWTQIKALANRLANWANVLNYSDLQPASDAAGYIVKLMSNFLNTPMGWVGDKEPNENEKEAIINKLSNIISDRINELIVNSMKNEQHAMWVEAYNYRGPGSAAMRSQKIKSIYDYCVPAPMASYDEFSDRLVRELSLIIETAIGQLDIEQ